jgi:hypothetical protein
VTSAASTLLTARFMSADDPRVSLDLPPGLTDDLREHAIFPEASHGAGSGTASGRAATVMAAPLSRHLPCGATALLP